MGKSFTASKGSRIGRLLISILVFINVLTSGSFAVAASAAPDTFVTKSNVDLPSSAMTNIAYGNNMYIAVGYYGAIIKSTDADNWSNVKTLADVTYTGVTNTSSFVFYGAAYGNGKFVVTGNEGVILTSTDGTDWTQQTSGVTKTIMNVKYLDHNGVSAFYALTEGKLLKSADGITWTAVVPTGLNAATALTQITVGNNGTRLAVGDTSGFIYSTTNGTTWTSARPMNPDGNSSIGTNMLVWMKDRYYISDPMAYVWTSTDLSTFTLAGAPFKQNAAQVNNQMFNGFYDGTKYYLFGYQAPYGYGAVYTSTDGTSWTMQPYKNYFVTQSSSYLNGKYFRLGNEGLMVSSNGSDWSHKWGGTYNEIIHEGSQYVAVGKQGGDGTIWNSSDLTSWTPATVSARANSFNAVAYGNGKYVAVGEWNQDKTSVATSADGSAWTVQSGVTDSTIFTDIAFGNGKFVAVGSAGYTTPKLKTSVDGVTWSDPTLPVQAIQTLFSVTFTNNQFIALGYAYDNSANVSALSIWTSPDGTNWTNRSSSYPNQTDAISDIIYDGSKYILLGYDPSYKIFSRTSDDLATWSAPTLTGNDSLFGITPVLGAKGNNIYALGALSGTYTPVVYYSDDQGTTWQNANVNLTNAQAYSLMSVNGQVIISGNSQLVMTTTSPVSSTISPDTASFDKRISAQADVSVTLTLNGNSLTDIKNGPATLVAGTDYDVNGNTVTIKKGYLATQAVGTTTTLTFDFSAGNPQTLAITVSDNTKHSVITPTTGSFDKRVSAQADVTTDLTLDGNTLSSIKNSAATLVAGTDYTVTGTTVAIKKSYLSAQAVGTTTLTFEFSEGNPQTLAITVSDNTKHSVITPTSGSFDKKVSAQADVTTDLTLDGNTLSSIKNSAATLVAGTDYTVTGTTVAIKKSYLSAQAVGTTTLTFEFSEGNPQTLAITVSDNTKHSVITPTTGSFDKKVSAQADVTTDLTLDGNALSSIKNSAATLVAGTDYTVTGTTVAIKKSYLSAQAVGTTTLTFEFSEGNPQTLAITVSDNTKHSVITPTTGSFDKKVSAQADVTTELTLDGNMLSGIKNGATLLVAGTDYTVTGTTVAIKKSYLSAQAVGTTTLTFEFNEGNPQILAITVSDNTKHSVITPTSGSFDKKVSAQADVTTDLTLDGNTLSGIKNGATLLVAGTDYTVTGTTVAIKKSYLSAQTVGTTTLTFEFSEGNPQTLAITVSDSTKNSVITPTSGSFDKKVSAQADVTTDLTLDGNTLSSIKNGAATLVPGTDYDVNGNTVAIKKEYLVNQAIGVTNLTFEFNAGAAQTLTIAVTDSTPNNSDIGPTSANFDKNTAAQVDVAVTLTLNGNTFTGIKNGDNVLIEGTDYTLSGSTVSIKKEYLANQPVGTIHLAFQFSAGSPQVLAITVTDSTPIVEGPPVLQSAVAGNAEVNLIWTPVKGSNGYKIYYSLVSGNFGTEAATVSSSVYSYDVKGLINGATYYFAVRSSLSEGEGLLSNELSATPKGAPGAPTNVTASAGDGQATVFFTPPLGNGGSDITRYDVLDAAGKVVGTGTSSPITITGLSNGTTYSFTVKAVSSEGSSTASASSNAVTPSAPSSGGGNNPTPTPTTTPNTPSTPTPGSTGVDIIVNGKVEKIGTAETTQVNNQTVTTISVDQSKLEEKLANEGQGVVITIPVVSVTDVAIGQLTGQMIKEMEQKQAVLELKTEQATYTLPAQQININAISNQFGSSVSLQDIKVQIEIDKSTPETLKIVENSAAKGQFTLVAPPLEFKVVAIHGDKTIEISKFNTYVERTIAIPDGVDPNKITTGIVVDPDGTVRHVPTKIVVVDGKYFAKVNSLTNSTYSIVWHPMEFKDVANHWSKNAVNNMGSRMVIDGVGNGLFNPGQDITRAEFAAIMVRGLGLKLENGGTAFTDVQDSAWYSSAVQTAVSYNLINGFEDGTFRPTDKITREQAMNIIAKAMKITGLKDKLATQAPATGAGSFTDAVQASGWAKSAIADSLQAGIVSGRSSTELAPKASITRAEVAAIIERLLQKSDLIQ